MAQENKNTPAFARSPVMGVQEGDPGLTKREYFAALALQGILASPNFSVTYKDAAHEATHYADALLASLEPLEF